MSVTCTVFGHVAGSVHAHNQGLDFAACHGCGRDLIRSADGPWTEVPRGFQVVWREFGRRDDAQAVAARLARQAAIPARPAAYHARPARRRRTMRSGMFGVLRDLRGLLEPFEPRDDRDVLEPGGQYVICLPGATVS